MPRFLLVRYNWLAVFFCLSTFAAHAQTASKHASRIPVKRDPYSAYLFVYFTGNDAGEEAIRFATSPDGLNYKALNNNQPVLPSANISASGGVRDPHILRGSAGLFYMVVTDMHVARNGWGPNEGMVLLKSNDLTHWQSSKVHMPTRFPAWAGVNRVWAPQTIYDPQKKKYLIYWSMRKGNDPDVFYYAYANADFTDLETEPQVLYASPGGKSCIDADIILKDGQYHLFYKTEGSGNGIKQLLATNLTGPYAPPVPDPYLQQTKDAVEGAGVFKLNNSDKWVLMYDVYTKGRYEFTGSTDLINFKKIDGQVSMNFTPRHGTVLPITTTELQALTRQWATTNPPRQTEFKPGQVWYDDKGEVINAHGGGLLVDKGTYYWFGEKRGKSASEGVNVYSSKDLYNWKMEGLALAKSTDTTSEIATTGLMERPKVIYNPRTKQYVMWFHLELPGKGYSAARAGVAVSKNVTGPYTYVKSFRPNGHMSRDMTLYVDDDGSAYEIYSARENYDLRIVKLTDDYLSATTQDTLLFSDHREAPAVFKKDGQYYLITSGCTGWAPNRASLHVAKSLFGPWTPAGDPMRGPMADKTFDGQSTYILPVQGRKDAYIFIADRWNSKDLKDSRYLWLPISFTDNQPVVEWTDAWNLGIWKK